MLGRIVGSYVASRSSDRGRSFLCGGMMAGGFAGRREDARSEGGRDGEKGAGGEQMLEAGRQGSAEMEQRGQGEERNS